MVSMSASSHDPRSAARRLARDPRARALLALAAVLVIGCAFHGDGAFFRWSTHRDLLREISVIGILACGMTLVILSGGIDLAVGSVLALSAVSFAWLTIPHGFGALPALAGVIAVGLAAGSISGLLVARFRLQPFIVTLAMMVFARGLAKRLSGGTKVSAFAAGSSGVPAIFDQLDARVLGGNVAVVTLVFLACVAVTAFILRRTRLGRYLYAVGGNAEAARFSGVPVPRVLGAAYALSGLFAAIAGICQAAQETHGDPETAMGYELDAIAMVVIGGTSLSGGRGGIGLTLIGALTIGYLRKILSLNAFSTDSRLMLTGAIIVGAALFQRGRGSAW
ncbi:Ribose ABC transport system, permease protein RbsC [Minicystis rosea]|nr:Ribose ABC transport system, permease protein RbsC [Minicystis rosea]